MASHIGFQNGLFLVMLRGKSLQYRHLAITLSASFFSLFFTNDLMEGCAPGVVRGTKYDEDLVAVEPLPLPAVGDIDCLQLSIPKAASWAFFAAAASFFPSFS